MSTNHIPVFTAFAPGTQDWREAVAMACQPLNQAGVDAAALAGAITSSVDRYGPYFIVVPGAAVVYAEDEFIPQALAAMEGLGKAGNGSAGSPALSCPPAGGRLVNNQTDSAGSPALSFLRTDKAVSFDPDDPACAADIFLVPSALEREGLLGMAAALARLLHEEGLAERLRSGTEAEAADLLSGRLNMQKQ